MTEDNQENIAEATPLPADAQMMDSPVTGEPIPISLTGGDLTLIANVIDLAVQRGAFKGAEAQTVGAAFNKLVSIIKAITPAQPAAEGDDAPTTEAPAEGTSEE